MTVVKVLRCLVKETLDDDVFGMGAELSFYRQLILALSAAQTARAATLRSVVAYSRHIRKEIPQGGLWTRR